MNHTILVLSGLLLLGWLWIFDPSEADLPLCTFHAMTGLDCPGCGATRATHELLHGRFGSAMHYNALWVFSMPPAIYLVLSEMRLSRFGRPLPGNLPRQRLFWILVAAAAMVFFVARNLC
jgi:hypothetical protein